MVPTDAGPDCALLRLWYTYSAEGSGVPHEYTQTTMERHLIAIIQIYLVLFVYSLVMTWFVFGLFVVLHPSNI